MTDLKKTSTVAFLHPQNKINAEVKQFIEAQSPEIAKFLRSLSDDDITEFENLTHLVLDWDETAYFLDKTAVGSPFPNNRFNDMLRPQQYWEFKAAFAKATSALTGICSNEALSLAINGWEDPEIEDCTHYIAIKYQKLIHKKHNRFPDEKEIASFKENLDRAAHSILRTNHWNSFDGLGQTIQDVQNLGINVVFWTHGKTGMITRTMGHILGPEITIPPKYIFDKQSKLLPTGAPLGRKDRGTEPFEHFIENLTKLSDRVVTPENCRLIDDKEKNCKTSRDAGWQRPLHVAVSGDKPADGTSLMMSCANTTEMMQLTVAAVQYARILHGRNHDNCSLTESPSDTACLLALRK